MLLLRDERGHDQGETLIEILVTVVILGIAGAAVMAGLGLAIKTSDIGRKATTSTSYVRSYAEKIKNYVAQNGLPTCATASATYAPGNVGFLNSGDPSRLPAGYTATASTVQSWTSAGWGACSASGVQRVVLIVKTPDGRANESLAVILRKPCSGTLPNPC